MGRYESVEYLLVDDRTGAETTVVGEPVVSADGSRLACLVLNLVNAGFARLEISLDRRILNLRRVLTSEPPTPATT